MKRSFRVPLAALVLFLGVGGLCAAWYVSSQRAFDAEVTLQSQLAARQAGDRERVVAGTLAERLETLRRTESQRPYFHYQNLYHDPKGASQGLSVTPSPLATGSLHPLVVAHFQIDAQNGVTLPTLNEELGELNAPNAAEQRALRAMLAASAGNVRTAAESLREQVEKEAKAAEATAKRIAQLEARLAQTQRTERQREEARREEARRVEAQRAEEQRLEAARAEAARIEAARVEAKKREVERLQKERADLERKDQQRRASNQSLVPTQRSDQVAGENVTKVEVIDPSAFQQNVNSNVVYQQLKQKASSYFSPTVTPQPSSETPIEILTSDLEWRTVTIDRKPRLVALRAVHTPAGTVTQGMLTALAEGSPLEGAVVHRGEGSAIEGTGWRVQLPPDALSSPAEERQRFLRMFVGVSSVLMLVVVGVIWTLWHAEKLANDRTRFAATAAHELRTPLASLRLYSDLIAEEEDPLNRERYARELASQTERLGRVVANVLEVTRIERGAFTLHPQLGEIGPAVEECIDRLRPQMEAASCPLHLRVAPDLPEIAFDADAIHHVVDNLVDNAEKYSRDVPDRSISVDVAREQDGVAITVTDRGPGIADELFRVPKPFRRAASPSAPAGLGLGLFLVDRIVRGHGGVIRSTAAEGGGARVHVFLPAFYKA
ncbi:MAG TPA: HAMP domain-containing sensor histidine kinase [Thermoanaerobaculia bacterium]|jgi:signal transduction histidine kinase|nr:HAMP domain-containing sensor histidine kinase [Thermoanaerobaculia bacterium]